MPFQFFPFFLEDLSGSGKTGKTSHYQILTWLYKAISFFKSARTLSCCSHGFSSCAGLAGLSAPALSPAGCAAVVGTTPGPPFSPVTASCAASV